jgi:signal transduction histidine kinase/DNA-binding response OmpR family regulator
MNKLKIEIQSALLAAVIILAVVFSGYYFFRSLTGLVNVVHIQSQTDPALTLVHSIAAELPDIENQARLFILSGDGTNLTEYKKMNDSVVARLQTLTRLTELSNFDPDVIDSLRTLVLKRLITWNEIIDIHMNSKDPVRRIPELSQNNNNIMAEPADTIVQEIRRKGFLANLFRKKKTETVQVQVEAPPVAVPDFRQEFEQLQKDLELSSARLRMREAELLEINQEAAVRMSQLIWLLDTIEKSRLEKNAVEAGHLAVAAKQRITVMGVLVVLLVSWLLFLMFRFLKKNSETQKLLIRSKIEAEELARTKELFIANVSHEMRTPVNAIHGIVAQMVQRDIDDREKKELGIVLNSSRHLLNVVNDTLDLARIHSNMLVLNPVDFNPEKVFTEAVDLVKQEANAKNIWLIHKNMGKIPKALVGDPLRLKQMVLNLLSNAIKFTEKGHVMLEVASDESEGNVWLRVKVSDTGAGIAESELQGIFGEFVQAETNDPARHRGTGLGLSILKKLAEIQGGNVSISSQKGTGTVAEFSVPYKPGSADSIQSENTGVTLSAENLKGKNILVADDEEYNRYLLGMILNKWGVNYAEAVNGEEAVKLAGQQVFDAVLMDVRMPVMNGYRAAEEILKIQPDILILALTATVGKDEEARCVRSGMKALLPKPFTENQLAEILDRFLLRNELSEEFEVPQESSEKKLPDKYLHELKRIAYGDQQFFVEMAQIFIRSTENGMKEIREAYQKKDYETLSHLAHKLTSPVKHLQAHVLYEKIKKLENMHINGLNQSDADVLIGEIEREIGEINAYFLQEVKQAREG